MKEELKTILYQWATLQKEHDEEFIKQVSINSVVKLSDAQAEAVYADFQILWRNAEESEKKLYQYCIRFWGEVREVPLLEKYITDVLENARQCSCFKTGSFHKKCIKEAKRKTILRHTLIEIGLKIYEL